MVNEVATHADTGFLNAAVADYGSAPAAADVPNMRVPLMLHYAGLDSRINGGMPGYTAPRWRRRGALHGAHVRGRQPRFQ